METEDVVKKEGKATAGSLWQSLRGEGVLKLEKGRQSYYLKIGCLVCWPTRFIEQFLFTIDVQIILIFHNKTYS